MPALTAPRRTELIQLIADAFTLDDLKMFAAARTSPDAPAEYFPRDPWLSLKASASGEQIFADFIDVIIKREWMAPLFCGIAAERPGTALDTFARQLKVELAAGIDLDDPTIKALVATWRTRLEGVVEDLERLTAYKDLHDILHDFQVVDYGIMMMRTKNIATDDIALDDARNHAELLRQKRDMIVGVVMGLPEGEQADQAEWVKRFGAVHEEAKVAADNRDDAAMRRAGMWLNALLRERPKYLNQRLVAIARRVPLRDLCEALRQIQPTIVARFPGLAGEVAGRIASLHALEPSFSALIALHNSWQEADDQIWRTRDLFAQASAEALEELHLLFPPLAKMLAQLGVTAIDGIADAEVSRSLCDTVAKLDPLLAALVAPPLPKDAGDALKILVRGARNRFYEVDKTLKRRCGEVDAIRQPIRTMLDRFDPVGHRPA